MRHRRGGVGVRAPPSNGDPMASAARRSRSADAAPSTRRRPPKPVEYNILLTATLCLLAAGAVMVYSASSARTLLEGQGDGTAYLVKYLVFGAVGLVLLQVLARGGLELLPRVTPALLALSFVLLVVVKLPGVGVEINGARRWIGAGPLQFQPSELMKLALVLYATGLLATTPSRLRSLRDGATGPLLLVAGAAIALGASQPDLGTARVIAVTLGSLLLVAGVPLGLLGRIAGVCGLLFLYGLIGYAGLRTAKAARTRYTQLLAAGLTSLILCQALLNVFAVLGIAPLTGVPLPFISSGSSSLLVLLATMGLLLNVASRSTSHLASLPVPDSLPDDAQGSRGAQSAHRSGRDGRARGARAGGRRAVEGGGR